MALLVAAFQSHAPAAAQTTDVVALTDVGLENPLPAAQNAVPVSFGQVFAPGDLRPGASLLGVTTDGRRLPLQVDIKASHADGSVRHAIVSVIFPVLPGNKTQTLALARAQSTSSAPAGANLTPARLLATDFDATVRIMLDGQVYTAAARPALAAGRYRSWLAGPVAAEWLVTAPLLDERGAAHPHLHVRYAIRDYADGRGTRVDATVENDWAFQAAPQNFTYDVLIDIAGHNVYARSGLTHYHHARWRKVFWWGEAPQVNVRSNVAYLIDSKAVPNYDRKTFISELTLRAIGAGWNGAKTEPMASGVANPGMPTTGGRPDIGLIPGWGVTWLLSMDRRARDAALGTASLAGSWSIHYRDQKTDRPVTLESYPYMTLLGHASDAINPKTGKSEAFPPCQDCSNPNVADSAHMPAFNFLPYLLSGDYYQLEELQFWTLWAVFKTNPGYRGNVQGLVHRAQVRDQAWSLRNIADAAYITPDQDPLKPQLLRLMANNLAWYNANYSNNANANSLGINVDNAIEYNNKLGIAPWMDDFFTSAVGRAAELGFANAAPLLRYKAKFPVARMTQPGFCWIFGAMYSINVRPTPTAALYAGIDQAYASSLQATYPSQAATLASLPCAGAAMADALKLRTGEMSGYSAEATGFPSNLQPALAYSVDGEVAGAAAAWEVFMKRSVKPDYGLGPQFAIVPRAPKKAD
ncbi:hypothetical protein [Herbaspirillum robiniae]|uniref:hypothetical protein n=1 Tax=Herbaspirillum robiniae TaxID=2014887 RepID=UPI003D787157